ncbi:MAG: class I SAM-dependent methyltransferase [Bacteroidales bacterium]
MKNEKSLKTLYRPCPICQAKEGEVLHTQQFLLSDTHLLPSEYDIVYCPHCGFVFADTPAAQSTYNRFYQEMSKYEDKHTASGGGDTIYDLHRIEETANTIANFINNKEAKILDIGCGNGGILFALKQKGFSNIMGFDPSLNCVKTIREKGIKAVQGNLFEKTLSEQFDFIILSHVFEHICDLSTAVDNVHSLLDEKGCVYIETPNAAQYTDFYIVPYYYFDTEHINHFDTDAHRNLFEKHHFKYIASATKTMTVAENQEYPAVYSLFEKTNGNNSHFCNTQTLRNSILNYIDLSKNDHPITKLQSNIKNQKPIVIWGAGNYTARILQETNLGEANILFFVDSDSKKWGMHILEKEVVSPEALLQLTDNTFDIVVISALFSSEISTQIKNRGLKNTIICL